MRRLLGPLAAFCLARAARCRRAAKPEPKRAAKPSRCHRFTAFNHIMIRAKINGKGPFNFI
jgi:hypothetical protein